MKNKTIARLLQVSIGLVFFVILFENVISESLETILTTLAGFGIIIFGIWGSIRLSNKEKSK